MNHDATPVTDRRGQHGTLHRTANAATVHLQDGRRLPVDPGLLSTAEDGTCRFAGVFAEREEVDSFRIPVAEERLDVQKIERETGRVIVDKRVIENEKVVSEMLDRETVSMKRVPMDQVIPAYPDVRTEGHVTIVPVVEERLVVRKELVLTQEIHLTRTRESEPVEQVHTLRREQVEVAHTSADERD